MRIKKLFSFLLKLCLAVILLSPVIYLFSCFIFVPYHLFQNGWALPMHGSLEYGFFCLGVFVWVFALAVLFLVGPLFLAKRFPSLERKEDE